MKILFVTDFPANDSGYARISRPICNGLVDLGHEVKMVGISNHGEEHWNKFSVIPIGENLQEIEAAIHNLSLLWVPEVIVVALDIPMQEQVFARVRRDSSSSYMKYIAITPLENGPLSPSWASSLMQMDKVFFISYLGEVEGKAAGVSTSEHLKIGIDAIKWFPARQGEKDKVRENLGFGKDEKVFLTIADNQERKNFDTSFQIVSNFKKLNPDIKFKYVLVTKENSVYGWKPMELAFQYGIQAELVVFERGMPEAQLRLLYIASDAFLLTSKAEGCGMPVMEALACGLHCVTTNTGAFTEKLKDGVGWLIPVIFSIKHDVWGSSKRDFADPFIGAKMLLDAVTNPNQIVVEFPIEPMIQQVDRAITEIVK